MIHMGEPSPEVTASIWAEAAKRFSGDHFMQQSAFNDGAHYMIQRLREACAETIRLFALNEQMGEWEDEDAFREFNAKITKAWSDSHDFIAQVIGKEATMALWGAKDNFPPLPTIPVEHDDI